MKARKKKLRQWLLLEERVSKPMSYATEIIIHTRAEDDSSLGPFSSLPFFF